jgi:hypothetical protein
MIQYLDKMINEGKIRPSSCVVWSRILFMTKPDVQGLQLCVGYRHQNDYTKKDKMPLPIIDGLQSRLQNPDCIYEHCS